MAKQQTKKKRTLLNSDLYVAYMLSNDETARHFFEFVLPKSVLQFLDLNTLKNIRTRLTSPSGKDRFGDFFFTVDLREPSKEMGSRYVFTIILEHKSQDEEDVAL